MYIYVNGENILGCFSVSLANNDNVKKERACLSADW